MKDGLNDAYQLVIEKSKQTKKNIVSSRLKRGEAVSGDLKKAKGRMGPEHADRVKLSKKIKTKSTKIRKGDPLMGDVKKAGGRMGPEYGEHKKAIKEERFEDMTPNSNFDSLFRNHLLSEEDLMADESPLELGGSNEFNDETGDFPPEDGEDTTDEEVDIATELRLIIDRLTEIAEKVGSYDDDDDDGADDDSDDNDDGVSDNFQALDNTNKQSSGSDINIQMGESFSNKKNNKVKNILKAKRKKARFSTAGERYDGVMRSAKKTNLNPKMNMRADADSVMSRKGAMLFDN